MAGKLFFSVISAAFLLSLMSEADAQKKIVCYWNPGLSANSIDLNLCTHYVFSFLNINGNGDFTNRDTAAYYIGQLRSRSSSLKILVAVGGADSVQTSAFASMTGNWNARTNFINKIYDFLLSTGTNGVDIDWEYPENAGEKSNLVTLLRELKQKLGWQYSVSCAIGVGPWRTGISYDIPGIFSNSDFVNLMTYDIHGTWENYVGLHAALYNGGGDPAPTANAHESVKLIVNYGVNPSKIILGIPTYAKLRQLSTSNTNVGAPATSQYLTEIPYRDVCQRVRNGQYNERYSNEQQSAYAFSGSTWMSYDNVASATEKAKYINLNSLGGAMFWNIDHEDYQGLCGKGNNPLISSVKTTLGTGGSSPAPSPSPSPQPAPAPAPAPASGSFFCPTPNGLFKDPSNCAKYYNCGNGIAHSMDCPSGLLWKAENKWCDWPSNVVC